MEPELIHRSFYSLSFYRFLPLVNLPKLHSDIFALCSQLQLKGTILIASEGVNASVSGTHESIQELKTFVREHLKIQETDFKEAKITSHCFTRLLVKIKKEIISMGVPEIRPDQKTGERLSPQELKRWLDEGQAVILLDTRNQYEIEVGTFAGAQHLNLDSFRQFPALAPSWIQELQSEGKLQDRKVVTFCTGGIRCEKASAFLMDLGLPQVYQLDGGILRYLEENGSEHYEGNCFVFDWRLAVDGHLKPVPRSSKSGSASSLSGLSGSSGELQYGRHRTVHPITDT